jgi:molecular chaperone GrpE (heat shock protein)
MSSIPLDPRAKAFISVIFDIVVESLNSAMPNNEEINNLLRQASLKIEQNESVDSLVKQLVEQLSLEVREDPETLAMISAKLDEYRHRIHKALEANQKKFNSEDF